MDFHYECGEVANASYKKEWLLIRYGIHSERGDMLAVSIMMKTIKIKTLLEVLLRDASG